MSKYLTADDVRLLIVRRCARSTQHAVAKEAGISDAHLSGIINGRKEPYGAILKLVGVERFVGFRETGA